MQRHIAEYKTLLASDPQPPAGLHGDGVIFAMFEDYNRADLGILVGLKMLRQAGWQGRVQLWHVGHHPAIGAGLDVEIIDAREVQRRHGGYIQSWALKSFCMYYSGLRRVQWIDWDAWHACDPSPMFAALDSAQFLYWTGGTVESQANTRWPYNPEIHKAVYGDKPLIGPIQGGTYLLNCETGWKLLELQHYLDTNWEWWSKHNRWSDEEGWRLGVAATTPPVVTDRLEWRHPAWVNWFRGKEQVVHACNGKLWSDCIPTWHELPQIASVRELYERFRHNGGYNPSGRKCDRPATVAAGAKDDRVQRVQALRDRARKATERKTALDAHAATMRRKTICEGCPAFRLGDVRIERWCSLADERPGQPHDCAHGRYSRGTARLTNLESGKCPAGRWPA